MGGKIGQYHKPQVYVDAPTEEKAKAILTDFKRGQNASPSTKANVIAVCEECEKTTAFTSDLNGTTQECPHCQAYMDVGELDWGGTDFGKSEDEIVEENADSDDD